MGDTIEDMDIEIEQKNNSTDISKIKIGLPDCKIFEEMIKLGLEKIKSTRKGDSIMDILNNSLKNHKFIKNKKQQNLNFRSYTDLFIKTIS